MEKRKKAILLILGLAVIGLGFILKGDGSSQNSDEAPTYHETTKKEMEKSWDTAKNTPYGRYPKEITYTLGKISGTNNANLPIGESYEDNGYTRYLKEILNIQNKDVFEIEDGDPYNETVRLAIKDRDIPDIMVVKGRDNLKDLIQNDLVEDLTGVYESCTTDRVKEMYESYGEGLLKSASLDGKLYAFPDTVIDHGPMMLWMRKDWIDKLHLKDPRTMEEAMNIIREFVKEDVAGNQETIGLACNTNMVSKSSSTYSVDPIFTMFHTAPQKWILGEDGNVTYGSLTSETKSALAYLSRLYQTGILDPKFLLRTSENIDELINEGKCGAFFGNWWAPNNPLISSYSANPEADWQPYFLTGADENKVQQFASYNDWQYVVVKSGYEYPEIVPKYISVMFDYSRYQDKKADEINEYFALNVDPTARPMNINVDYRDALFRSTRDIRSALKGDYPVESLTGLERSYYNTCKSYLNGNVTTANAWAAYASRITAVGLLVDSGIESNIPLSLGDVDAEVPPELLKLEKQAFLQIVCGDKPVAYFDTFVSDWYSNGGKELTQKVRGAYQEQ